MVERQSPQNPENPSKMLKPHSVITRFEQRQDGSVSPEGDGFLFQRSKGQNAPLGT